MNSQEKVDLINALHHKVVDFDADGETCYFINVPLDNETRLVLRKLGKLDEWIDHEAAYDEDNELIFDLLKVGFEFANWWYEDTGFSLYKPCN